VKFRSFRTLYEAGRRATVSEWKVRRYDIQAIVGVFEAYVPGGTAWLRRRSSVVEEK